MGCPMMFLSVFVCFVFSQFQSFQLVATSALAGPKSIFELLETISKKSVISNEPSKHLLEWVLRKFRDILPLRDATYAAADSSSTTSSHDSAKQVRVG